MTHCPHCQQRLRPARPDGSFKRRVIAAVEKRGRKFRMRALLNDLPSGTKITTLSGVLNYLVDAGFLKRERDAAKAFFKKV
jgi:hypothetical protein